MFIKPELTCLSLAGRKHTDKGLVNEDAGLTVSKNGVHVICLADGAGGGQYTHASLGAQSVVKTITELLSNHFDAFYMDVRENVVRSIIVTAVQSELAILAHEKKLPSIDKLSSTMLFCAIKDSRVLFGHIGDGVIAKVSSSGIVPITLPQNGEDVASTYFITFPDAQDYLRIVKTTTDDAHAYVLMTDGIADSVFDHSTYHIAPVVARLAELSKLEKDKRYEELKTALQNYVVDASPVSDDVTVGIAYFPGTQSPDQDSLTKEKPIPQIDFNDVMRTVQMDLLPRVRMARTIVSKKHAPKSGSPAQQSDEIKASEEEKQEVPTPLPVKPCRKTRFYRSKSVYLWCLLLISVISVSIVLIIYLMQ